MNLVITGGAGFIGSHFVQMMAEEKEANAFEDIHVIDNLTYAGNILNINKHIDSGSVKFHQADICDFDALMSIIKADDIVVNFAAESHVDNSIVDPDAFVKTNVLGVSALLRASVEKKIKKFVQISTDEVYGSLATGSAVEEDALRPSSPYSATKASADLLCLAFHKTYGLDISITRAANNYGPNQFPEKLIPFFIKLLSEGNNVTLYGDGKNSREWIHVVDHCDAIARVMIHGRAGSIYNVGSGINLTNLEVTQLLLQYFNLGHNQISFVADRPGHDFRYSISSKKIQTELNFLPKRKLADELPQLASHYIDYFKNSSKEVKQ